MTMKDMIWVEIVIQYIFYLFGIYVAVGYLFFGGSLAVVAIWDACVCVCVCVCGM